MTFCHNISGYHNYYCDILQVVSLCDKFIMFSFIWFREIGGIAVYFPVKVLYMYYITVKLLYGFW